MEWYEDQLEVADPVVEQWPPDNTYLNHWEVETTITQAPRRIKQVRQLRDARARARAIVCALSSHIFCVDAGLPLSVKVVRSPVAESHRRNGQRRSFFFLRVPSFSGACGKIK